MSAPGPPEAITRTELLRTAADFARLGPEFERLRTDWDDPRDVLVDPAHFLADTDATRRPLAVACWSGDHLLGVLFATTVSAFGMPTGYAVAGDFTGRGGVLCRPEHYALVVDAAVDRLMRGGVHSLQLRIAPAVTTRALERHRVRRYPDHVPGDRLPLCGSYEAFLSSLGKHTRRNVRYYTRRAAAADIRFGADVTIAEYSLALRDLNRRAGLANNASLLRRTRQMLDLHQGTRYVLRDAAGEIVAVLSGFSHGGRFYLCEQLNDPRLASLSLSLVMRGHVIEHLIASGHDELQFMSGCSLSLGRFCAEVDYCAYFIDRRGGVWPLLKRLMGCVAEQIATRGRLIPRALGTLAGGYLSDERLVARTAIRPAMLLRQEEARRAEDGPNKDVASHAAVSGLVDDVAW